jgi:ribonuclease J
MMNKIESNLFGKKGPHKEHKEEQCPPDALSLTLFGGTGEIGMNLCAYKHNNKYLVVDMGIGFDAKLPGDNRIVVPKIDHLIKHRQDIIGIVVTHGHDDHIAAIPHLWKYLKCPIYATKFPAQLLNKKADDGVLLENAHIIEQGKWIDLAPFKIKLLNITHSIPESSSVVIDVPGHRIVHTGDWKLDAHPVVGNKTDEEGFKEIGNQGVTAVFCDSTNIMDTSSDRKMRSEISIQAGLEEIVRANPGVRVMVSCISTNIARMKTCYDVAKKCGRRLCLVGRSLLKAHETAEITGYWNPEDKVMYDEEGGKAPRGSTLYLCTGSQAEVGSSTERIAMGTHPYVNAEPGDTILFAARTITGNELPINAIVNAFTDKQVNVIFPSPAHHIHVSGHPVQEDVRTMYEWLKPQYVIPAHGEPQHLLKHAQFAKSCGIESLSVRNGYEVVFAKNTKPQIYKRFIPGRLMVDGTALLDTEGKAVKERYELQRGLVFAVIAGTRVNIDLLGLEDDPEELKTRLTSGIKQRLEHIDNNPKMTYYKARIDLGRYISNEIRLTSKRKPLVCVQLIGRRRFMDKRVNDSDTEEQATQH